MAGADAAEPRSSRAKALIDYLTKAADHPFGRVVALELGQGVDIVDLVVEPELVQRRVVPIRNQEPIRLVFPVEGDGAPDTYAARPDFPADLVHTNFDRTSNGCHLCIWEENWADLKRTLTAQALFERVRSWLSKTADGTLHQPGQALEPLIPASASTLVIPPGQPPAILHLTEVRGEGSRLVALLEPTPPKAAPSAPLSVFTHVLPPQVHGALHNYPRTLAELSDLLALMAVDLVQLLGDWLVQHDQRTGPDRIVLIVLTLPQRASARAKVSGWRVLALQPMEKLFGLGEKLGRTAPDPDSGLPQPLVVPAECSPLDALDLGGWRVVQRLDRVTARHYSGTKLAKDTPLIGIGAGAIGSNLMANAVRAGIGPWTIIDSDINLPHNIVRQLQFDGFVGAPKAQSAAGLVDAILAEGGNHAIDADFLSAGDAQAAEIAEALGAATLAVDFSASPAVLGALADHDRVLRAASFFFNPEGTDLVLLAEDRDRKLRLDEIEAQYFYAAGTSAWLSDHLAGSRTDFLRYANACQNLTRPVPPWQVQTLCGLGAGQLQRLLRGRKALAGIWQLSPATGTIAPVRLRLSPVDRHLLPRFRVTVAADVTETMRALRARSAPNETGGILLGSFDLARGVIHVVKALPAPPDSRQSPTYFVRGAKDLKPLVDEIGRRSVGTICYLGEWHSHPDGSEARPSDDDEEVFAYLHAQLDPTGTPYLMMICGEEESWLRAGWTGGEPGEAVKAHG